MARSGLVQWVPGSLSQYKLGYAVIINKPSNFYDLTRQMFISCPHKVRGRVAVLYVLTQQSSLFPPCDNSISIHGLREHLSRGTEAMKNPLPCLTALRQVGQHIPLVHSSFTSHPSPNLTAKEAELSRYRHWVRKKMDVVRFTDLSQREVTLVLLVDSRLKEKSHPK